MRRSFDGVIEEIRNLNNKARLILGLMIAGLVLEIVKIIL